LTLLLVSSAFSSPAVEGAPNARDLKVVKAAPHFPVRCTTVLTTHDVSKIVRRHVVTGRSSDVDPHTSLCYYGSWPGSTEDLAVSVDAYSPVYKVLEKDYTFHRIKALGGFGSRVAVDTTQPNIVEVVGLYGSWYLDVKAYAEDSANAYKTSQVMALAQRAYENATHARSGHR
jgi:hypothetical protein